MGLGKTSSAIMAVINLNLKKILIICPASLKVNWKREIDTRGCFDVGILGGEKGGTATPPDLSRSVQSSTAPLAVMERPKYSYGTVQYPEDLGTAEFGHYILFHIYQVSRSIYAGPQTYGPFLNGAGFRKDRQDKWHGTTTHEQKEGIATLVAHPNDHPQDSDLLEIDEYNRPRLKGSKYVGAYAYGKRN